MNTHPEQWAAMLQRPGSSWGFGALLKDTSVVVLKEERALVIHSPTNNPCRTWDSNPQPLDYESDSLTIRPRLPLFTTHTYFFISNLHISDLYTHNCLYYILCFCYFVHCLFVYLYIILLLSVSCPVAVILLHCGASVTITNSLYVLTYLANKAHSDKAHSKCKIFKVYLKYTCNSSTLAQSNILQYIFSWTSALTKALSTKLVFPI